MTGGQEVTKMVFNVMLFPRLSHAPGLVLLLRCLTASSLLQLKTLTRPPVIQRDGSSPTLSLTPELMLGESHAILGPL